jgi:hypothetical protein
MRAWVRLLVLAATLVACGGDDTTAEDTKASQQVAGAFDSVGELARLVQPLEASPNLMMTPDSQTQVNAADLAFKNLVGNDTGCMTIVKSMTTIDVTFRNCPIALIFRLNGSLHAGVVVAAGSVTTDVSTPTLTLSGPGGSRSVSGAFTLVQPIGINMPVEFGGGVMFSASTGETLGLSVDAQWFVNRIGTKTCVNFTGGAELTGNVLGELAPISLAGEEIKACRDECPTDGHVELSYGAGNVLVWDYIGGNQATVHGPNGNTITVTLPCNQKLDGRD